MGSSCLRNVGLRQSTVDSRAGDKRDTGARLVPTTLVYFEWLSVLKQAVEGRKIRRTYRGKRRTRDSDVTDGGVGVRARAPPCREQQKNEAMVGP
ncbi:hypothetical protein JOQ06_007420 [Pogonophryne albipinna]|uniref:Uncharacterized protein n=1 Tax=Pogonophryne albipinna TaxID=1090488 RepID=A0AAD6AYX8_9TELE|nr:hypothetical protein JOQ06_007420 [Pogonophryne albipinna]